MKIFEYIDRLNRIHRLITLKATGTPTALAKKLSISVSHLYNILDELKSRGAPIGYSRILETFYYLSPFDLILNYEFKALDESDDKLCGGSFMSTIFPFAIFSNTQIFKS